VRVSQPNLSASASPEARVRFRDNPGMEQSDDDVWRARSIPPPPPPPQSRARSWAANPSATATAMTDEDVGRMDFAAARTATATAAVMADDRYAGLRPAAANSHFTIGRIGQVGGNEEDTEDSDPIPEWMARGRA